MLDMMKKIILKEFNIKNKRKRTLGNTWCKWKWKINFDETNQSEIHPRKTNPYKKRFFRKINLFYFFELKRIWESSQNDLHNYFATHGNF